MTRRPPQSPSSSPASKHAGRAPVAVPLSAQKSSDAHESTRSARPPQALQAPGPSVRETPDPFTPANDEKEHASTKADPRLRKGPAWGRLFFSAVAALIGLYAVNALMAWIQRLMNTGGPLSWLLLALAALAALSAFALVLSELFGLLRLKKLRGLHEEAETAIATGDAHAAVQVFDHLIQHFRHRPDLAWPLARLKEVDTALIAPADLLMLAEKELLAPLDGRAHDLILTSARRVALLTALLPTPFLDLLIVIWQLLKLVRALSTLYGARPGWIGSVKLMRMALVHLAVTGTLALSDTFVQTILGRGLAGRLSARFGEGVINGIMTARIGISAMEIVRPLPFKALPAPSWRSMARALMRGSEPDKPPEKPGS